MDPKGLDLLRQEIGYLTEQDALSDKVLLDALERLRSNGYTLVSTRTPHQDTEAQRGSRQYLCVVASSTNTHLFKVTRRLEALVGWGQTNARMRKAIYEHFIKHDLTDLHRFIVEVDLWGEQEEIYGWFAIVRVAIRYGIAIAPIPE